MKDNKTTTLRDVLKSLPKFLLLVILSLEELTTSVNLLSNFLKSAMAGLISNSDDSFSPKVSILDSLQ
ncbi:hypothetical protein HERIO_1470 [Hepatospora eriocheir]|uniref:Uncharacterized protein n=1 Tax=Hepatospora eriocheir TaxID=1081669 RepID=A0A1X0QA70_9MICR|nr:hypothetical protein HERIO_1470 [Hepatospora eriocheir]